MSILAKIYCLSLAHVSRILAFLVVIICALTVVMQASAELASPVKLAWDAPSRNIDGSLLVDIAGYRVKVSEHSGSFSAAAIHPVAANQTHYEISGLEAGKRYYFIVTAVNSAQVESAPSNEVSLLALSLDSDKDGLPDSEEIKSGTDPYKYDTDGDGVSDGQEVIDGTNALDRGSVIERLGVKVCSEWNGFFNGLWNIFEQVNLSSRTLTARTVLYDINGVSVSSKDCQIAAGAQCDVLVHDFAGRVKDSYGKVCVEHDGSPGDLDGRMVYYRPDNRGNFEFALVMPLTNGKSGSQFVSFNTFQPSFASDDAANLVANWIQITSFAEQEINGKLEYYDLGGHLMFVDDIVLQPGMRRDYAAHRVGPSQVGLVKWQPEDQASKISLRNVRYLYDNPGNNNSFAAAYQLDALVGTGELIAAPLDTESGSAIVEMINTAAEPINVNVQINTAIGGEAGRYEVTLGAYSSYHLITDQILGNGKKGVVLLQSNRTNSLAAVVMQYRRSTLGKIEYVYAIPARPKAGSLTRSSYNTNLNQSSELAVINLGAADEQVSLNLVRADGTAVNDLAKIPDLKVPATGLTTVDLNEFEIADKYGVVTVLPESFGGSIVSWVLRRRGLDYVLPIPVRE